jgi:hypothetical protein
MTILEDAIIKAVEQVQAIKVAAHREPTHALLFKDHLLQRVNHEVPCDMYTLRATIDDLSHRGHLSVGPTINDTYIKIPEINEEDTTQE